MSNLAELSKFIKRTPRNINISELIKLIKIYNIDSSQVIFTPLFSITPDNKLIQEITVSKNDIIISINISKLPTFAFLENYYIKAENNQQHHILNLIHKVTSNFLHGFFYGLNFNYYKNYYDFNHNVKAIYNKNDSISTSICILTDSLQSSLNDYQCFFTLEKQNIKEFVPNYLLGKNSFLNTTCLSGVKDIMQPILHIIICTDAFSQNIIDIISNIIKKTKLIQQ